MSTRTKELTPLRALARVLGVATRYTDGLGRRVTVAPETLVRVCAAVGAPVSSTADAAQAPRAVRFYEKHGFQIAAAVKFSIGEVEFDDWLMVWHSPR